MEYKAENALDNIIKYCDWWIDLYKHGEYPYGEALTSFACVKEHAMKLKVKLKIENINNVNNVEKE